VRPVNLIPPEQRRGERAPLRTGFASYAVVAGLAVVLAMVTGLVLTSNDIADSEAEKAELEARKAAAEQQAAELAPYAEFASLQLTRRQTVASLAQSRFDWERVLRELAIVLPEDVWLVQMAGTVTPEVQTEGSPGLTLRGTVPGPALELVGCGATHESVARFVTALEDIDGVTRVGLDESKRPDISAGSGGGASAASGPTDDCRTRDAIARFAIVASFDAAAVPPVAGAAPAAPAAPEEGAPEAPAGESEVTEDAEAAREQQNQEVSDARQAAEVVGVAR
jgi:Tfp pilus assembly protein PilN